MRWARFLRQLGHKTQVATSYEHQSCDMMVALHARRSAKSIRRFRNSGSDRPLVVVLTGTDLYADIRHSRAAAESLELASRLVLLQPAGLEELSEHLHSKCRVIFQSARPVARQAPLKNQLEVVVSGHLRAVKDPFRAARAVRDVPPDSRLRVHHLGRALSDAMARMATREMQINDRYRWLGEVPHWQSRRMIARGSVLVLSSKMEGGASVVAEAVVNRTPVIASRISGTRGMLGDAYPGFFPLGDTLALRDLLLRFESDRDFAAELRRWCNRCAKQFSVHRERQNLRQLVREFT